MYGTYIRKQWKKWNKKIRKQNTVTQRDNMEEMLNQKRIRKRYTVHTYQKKERKWKRCDINEIGASTMHPIKACLVLFGHETHNAIQLLTMILFYNFFFFCLSNGQ